MKIRTLFLVVVLALITIFVALNWNQFLTPTTVTLLFAKIQAPLGLIMLGLVILLTLVFFVYALYLRSSAFVTQHKISKDLKEARELAEKAEQSRFTELKVLIETEFKKLKDGNSEQLETVLSKLEKFNNNLISAFNESRKVN